MKPKIQNVIITALSQKVGSGLLKINFSGII